MPHPKRLSLDLLPPIEDLLIPTSNLDVAEFQKQWVPLIDREINLFHW